MTQVCFERGDFSDEANRVRTIRSQLDRQTHLTENGKTVWLAVPFHLMSETARAREVTCVRSRFEKGQFAQALFEIFQCERSRKVRRRLDQKCGRFSWH